MRTINFKRIGVIVLSILCALCFAISAAPLFKARAVAVEPDGKAELYQLAAGENLYEGYVIKTVNDHLIVIDGGATTGADAPAYIDAALTAIAGTANYTVDYWFLSHAHSDHIYELAKILNGDTINFTVNNFVFDFPNFAYNESASTYLPMGFESNCYGVDYTELTHLKDGLTNYATKKGVTVTGATYYDDLNGAVVNKTALESGPIVITVDGVKLEILQTYSTADTQVNSNSMVIRAWVDGQSVLFLNDATVESGNRLIETYGREFLKSDIVQMAHHGQNGVDKNVYDAVNAKVRLWSCHSGIWNNVDGGYQTNTVRSWVGLPEKATDYVASEYDLISGLCTEPTDRTNADDWAAVLDGMKISLPYAPAYEYNFEMTTGASIRLTEGSTGIRFSATLATKDANAQYGFVIAPRAWFDGLGVTSNYVQTMMNSDKADDVIKLNSNVRQVGSHFVINGSIAKILDKNINLNFVGIGYEYKNGVYTDAHFDSLDDVTRSVSQVATAAYNDELYNDYGYSEEDIGVITGFINTSVANAEYSLAFADGTTSVGLYESKELTLSTNLKLDRAVWTSSNENVATVKDGVVTSVGIGSATITVKSAGKTATCTVVSAAETDAIVSFNGKGSETSATKVTSDVRENRSAGLVETEWLETYKGANGVLKVTAKAAITAPYVADIRINLPVEIESGATVRYYIEKSDATFFYFYAADGTYGSLKTVYASNTDAIPETLKGIWSIAYVDYSNVTSDKQAINILIQGGSASYEHVVYFDIIEQGNTTSNYDIMDSYGHIAGSLEAKLTGEYLADFSSDDYEKLVTDDTYGRTAEKIVAERLETYDGVDNVMKITTYNNNSDTFGDFTLILPKAMGSEGYTIRFMLASTTSTSTVLRILNPRTEVGKIQEYTFTSILGKWQEVFVPYTGDYKQEVTFQIWGNADGVNVFYIDYVADGDCVEAMATERQKNQLAKLADSLTGDYLADFSTSAYEYTVGYSVSPNVATSITTEYLATKADANGAVDNGVLKITSVNNASQRGNVRINLPKASASGKMTVKFMVEKGSTTMWFIDPGTNATEIKTVAGGSSSFATSDTWTYMTLDQSACEHDCIEFLFANSAAGDTNVLYVAAVVEGDKVAELKEEAITATKTALAASLADDAIADFSSAGYGALVGNQRFAETGAANCSVYAATSLTAEYIESMGAETNLLKVTATTTYGGFSLRLPKAIGSEGFTIRFMIEQMSDTTSIFQILNPYTEATSQYQIYDANGATGVSDNIGKWLTVYVSGYAASDYADANEYVDFRLYTSQSSTKIIYIDEILAGDQRTALENRTDRNATAETRTAIAASLSGDYLADFATNDYTSLAFASNGANRAAASVTAERLDVYEGESGVLKITSTNSSIGVGDIKLLLPKASTTGTITVKIRVESDCPYVWFIEPNTTVGMYLSVDGSQGDVAFIRNGDTVNNTGSWQTMTLYYTNVAIRDQIDIIFAGGTAGATNTIYIAYVLDGAGDTTSASSLFRGNETFYLFSDLPPQGDDLRIADYAAAGFTHYLITEDQRSLFLKDDNGEYIVDDYGNYILNTEYLGFINNAIDAGLEVIMRNMYNKPDYFNKLTAEQIATLQAVISGYYMCDEPSHVYKESYKESTYVAALSALVDWYNQNGKDADGEYTLFHVNLLQSYGIEDIVHKGEGVTFEEYVANYVETVLKTVNGKKTISTDYYALANDGEKNYIKSDFIRNLYVIANAAKTLRADGHDVITSFCIQLCGDEGLSLRLTESVNDVRFQTALYAAFGATSFEYYGYLGYMYDQNDFTTTDAYDYVKTVNAELQNLAKAISLFDWNGYQFISKGNNTVTNIEGTCLSSFSGLSSVTSTADAVVSEFKSGNEYAYMAVNYTEPTDNVSNTVTFNFGDKTSAAVIINGVRSDIRLTNGTYSVTLGAGDSVFIYAYNG